MRKNRLFKQISTAFIALMAAGIYAQEDFILDPSQLVPADTGYYIEGVHKDKDQDGSDEFYNGCVDEYGDANHNESDIQQGFRYNRCMIMPTCYPKDAVSDPSAAEIDHAEGYIELTKTKYVGTDSAVMGYIVSPSIENLVSLALETSPDVSASDQRHIYFLIEYSKDNGENWENAYIQDETTSKKGDLHEYSSTNADFNKMITASQSGSIVLRVMTKPQIQIGDKIEYASQRLKVHYLKIVGEKGSAVRSLIVEKPELQIVNNTIYCENNTMKVYNTLGQFMGTGNSVAVKNGIYIVRFENGATRKILVNQ
jgi:hypothetical protein